MDSNANKPEPANAPAELAQTIHRIIQNMPIEQRASAYKRVGELLLLKPNQNVDAEIMACLEPGFQNMQGRA